MSDEPAPADGGTAVEAPTPSVYDRWTAIRGEERTVVGLSALAVVVFPYIFARAPVLGTDIFNGYQGLATLILIWGIFAIGFDLLLGFTGLLSFGHAALWGGAAYAAGYFSAQVHGDPLLMVLVGTTFAVLMAWVLGFLSLRRGGIYFAILTLAFAQMLFYMASSPLAFITGGENGFTSVSVDGLFSFVPGFAGIPLENELPIVLHMLLGNWMYVFVGTLTVLSVAFAYRILNSPYGTILRAIRENEQRAEFVGLNVWRYKLTSFVLSGVFAGVAGSLFAIHGRYVPLQSLYWTESGEIVIITVLGGVGSLFGPMLGAGVYLYVENIVSGGHPVDAIAPYWHLALGFVFVVVVWLFPDGIWGAVERVRDAVGDQLGGDR